MLAAALVRARRCPAHSLVRQRRALVVLLPLLAAACVHRGSGTGGTGGTDGTWSAAPSLRNARAAHAVVATGGAIYVLGGTGAGHAPVLEVEKFDGREWRAETTLPGDGLNATAAAVLGDRIYLIGGFSTVTNVPVSDVRVYDTRARTWSSAAPLPEPRGGHAAIVVDGKIHVLGGGNSQRTLEYHSVYDPATNTWRDAAPLPRSEGSPAAAVFDGHLYAIGGRSGPNDFGDVYIYDAASDAWSMGPPIPPRGTAGAVVYCGAIHLVGGESQSRRASLGEQFVLASGAAEWRAAPPMPTPRNFARAVLLGGQIYVVGGSPTPEPSHASEGSPIVERYRARC